MNIKWLDLIMSVLLAFAVTIIVSLHQEFSPFNGYLIDTDSYERLARIAASVNVGHLLYFVPGDNGNQLIPLHWSHLLDLIIISLSWPLSRFIGWQEALHVIGASIGPLSLAAVALAAIYAAKQLYEPKSFSILPAILCISAPGLLGYAMFGRADHHVWLVFLALLITFFLTRSLARDHDFSSAAYAGITSGIALWLSPEALPFILLGWGFLLIGDAKSAPTLTARTRIFGLAFSLSTIIATAIDPPFYGYFSTPLDRISLAYCILAFLMYGSTYLMSRVSLPQSEWGRALIALAPTVISLGAWFVLFPKALQGTSGVLASPHLLKFINNDSEMQPITDLKRLMLFAFFPTLILLLGTAVKLRQRIRPDILYAFLTAIFLIAFAFRHVRFSIYLEAAAAIIGAIQISYFFENTSFLTKQLKKLLVTLTSTFIIVAPILGAALVGTQTKKTTTHSCDPRKIKTNLDITSPSIILAPINYGPAILYFSKASIVAGPYHRASDGIDKVINAFKEKHFLGPHVPASVMKTGARYILVCKFSHASPNTLEYTIAHGGTPSWAVDEHLPDNSGFRMLGIKY